MNENEGKLVLNGLAHMGPITYERLMKAFSGDIAKIFNATKKELKRIEGIGEVIASSILSWREGFDLEREKANLRHYCSAFIGRGEEGYPKLLENIYDPPIGLYYSGNYRSDEKTVAIVGSRRCTLYGLKIAKQLAFALAKRGYCIASGLARGIDTAAHEGAIEGGGKTVAVLGCGLDIIYPPENKALYAKIRESGALISEFPFGKKADKLSFPRRNRIVAGLSKGVIVVETNSNGGSMITANFALESGRSVFAVPGRVDEGSSRGCHELIREGAILCRSVEDVVEELEGFAQGCLNLSFEERLEQLPEDLSEEEKFLLNALLKGGAMGIDTIGKKLEKAANVVSSFLMMLEIKGLVGKRADGKFEATI